MKEMEKEKDCMRNIKAEKTRRIRLFKWNEIMRDDGNVKKNSRKNYNKFLLLDSSVISTAADEKLEFSCYLQSKEWFFGCSCVSYFDVGLD